MLSRQVKKRLGDGRQRGGQQCGSVGSPPFGVGRRAAYGRTGPIVANRLSGSGRPSDVAMVEATDFANRDDLAEFRPLNWAAVGRILVEREVSTRPVVVREVASQGAAQVPFAKDEDVIQTLSGITGTGTPNTGVNTDGNAGDCRFLGPGISWRRATKFWRANTAPVAMQS